MAWENDIMKLASDTITSSTSSTSDSNWNRGKYFKYWIWNGDN